jgi:hypothetical protein
MPSFFSLHGCRSICHVHFIEQDGAGFVFWGIGRLSSLQRENLWARLSFHCIIPRLNFGLHVHVISLPNVKSVPRLWPARAVRQQGT